MNQRDMRPPFAALGGTIPPELEKLPTPCYLLDEDALTRNAEILGGLAQRTGCKVLLAQKAFSNYDCYPLLAPHLAGTEASGLFEARLGAEEMPGKEVHVFCAAYRADEMDELVQYADHIVFNSPAQLAKFGPAAKAAGPMVILPSKARLLWRQERLQAAYLPPHAASAAPHSPRQQAGCLRLRAR